MCDELVKALRCMEQKMDCRECAYYGKTGCNCEKMAIDAADAIEGLAHAVAQMTEWRKNPWIPVTERLPEKTNHYLVYIECECDGEFFSAWMQVAWFCEKFYWDHLHGDDVFRETVTHWMPLPEPPKEEI